MRVKIHEGFVVRTDRGVFCGGTVAELSQEEIDANPGTTTEIEVVIATPVEPPREDPIPSRFSAFARPTE